MAVAGGDALFDECAFVDSTSADDGGALCVSIGGRAEIRRSSFENCSAGGLGGGVAGADSATLTIRYCVFDDFVTAREEASWTQHRRIELERPPYSTSSPSRFTRTAERATERRCAALRRRRRGDHRRGLEPPEGFAYRAQGAVLVARADTEPRRPSDGPRSPPPRSAAAGRRRRRRCGRRGGDGGAFGRPRRRTRRRSRLDRVGSRSASRARSRSSGCSGVPFEP